MNHLQVVVPQSQTGETGRTVLWVSELPESITEMDLEQFFQDYKEAIMLTQINRQVNRMMDTSNPRSLTATVIFKDHKKADEARKALNMRKLRGKTVRIMWHEKDNSLRYNSQANLFVKNIASEVKAREFYEKILAFGDIVSAKLCENEDGIHNGYGYVSYYSSESAERAIQALNEKEVWGQKLEVKRFLKKNERFSTLTTNRNIYVKNLPARYSENDIKDLFKQYGQITWAKVMVDEEGRKSSVVGFESEESTRRAIEGLKGHTIDGVEIFVDSLMKKSDRMKFLSSKINDNNYKNYVQFKDCNLHIRNLPHDANEDYLKEVFSQFGEVKSVKIPKFILVTKVKNDFVEQPMSNGFGYVCFQNHEDASKAKEEMNGKFLPKFVKSKRPLLIDLFQPKHERKQLYSRYQQQYNPTKQVPMLNSMMNPFPNNLMPFQHPNLQKHIKPQQMHPYPAVKKQHYQQSYQQPILPQQPIQAFSRTEDPDIKYLESLEDESAKRDYLGEIIFKKIENHQYSQSHNFTIDTIGKITGMILGIDDLNEIVDIALNNENLNNRISEALALLEGK